MASSVSKDVKINFVMTLLIELPNAFTPNLLYAPPAEPGR